MFFFCKIFIMKIYNTVKIDHPRFGWIRFAHFFEPWFQIIEPSSSRTILRTICLGGWCIVSEKKQNSSARFKLFKTYSVDDFSFANDVALRNSAVSFAFAVGESHVTDRVRVAAKWWPVDAVRALPRLVPCVFETEASWKESQRR